MSATAARSDLALGFAAHVGGWAKARGAPAEAVKALEAAAAEVSAATEQGSVCIPLAGELRSMLLASRMVATPESGETLPLVLDGANRLYLRRYFDYELRLARNLLGRAGSLAQQPLQLRLDETPDPQRMAVDLAMRRRLAVVSGGPGTGKTTTVALLLARILEEKPDARIALAAPTGKAAARLMDTLRERTATLPERIRAQMPTESHTIHRLLGATAEPGRFRHDAAHALALDVLVVDEASMLDLSLATHLVEAVPAHARLVLLGDKDQLAAVEAGSVFAELAAKERSPLAHCVVWLTESHRFPATSGIGRLAADINAGEPERALHWMTHGANESVTWIDDAGAEPGLAAASRMLQGYEAYVEAVRKDALDRRAAFRAFDSFRVLCAMRESPRGVRALNATLGRHIRSALDHPLDPGGRLPWYPGRAVMVQRNDYVLRVFNGDTGICLPADDGSLAVWFADREGTFRAIAPSRLPEHEDAWASTVHKAQGSEFETLLCMLPAKDNPGMVRELLYTAVTRARRHVALAGSAEAFRTMCLRRSERHAGLLDRMRERTA
ncbi:MAG TPA: exodeoxyribonuclease V subunit alpha [Burkholderiales bacterium]|nr:exodeoxyribonuclease V subunit alpha [Burkholderiales bacterium]